MSNKHMAWVWAAGYVAFGLWFAHNGTYLVTINGQEATASFWTKFLIGLLLLPGIGMFGVVLLFPFVPSLMSFLGWRAGQEEEK